MEITKYICNILTKKLDLYEGNTHDMYGLCSSIFENHFIFNREATEWIEENSSELLYILSDIEKGNHYHISMLSKLLKNISDNPCAFFHDVAIYVGKKVLNNCTCIAQILNKSDSIDIELTPELISQIKKEITMQIYS